ncbi:MAG: ABC transporter permease [Lachnospiraceae bacterium]|nr:ABC transporter permease [Lachnospiraceae bacterium]MDY3343363.1 ABC transporter permease [Lachnospiraceae bacterium]
MFITWTLIQSALELGIIYGIIALALFLTYSMLNVCDLSTDGCYTMGAAAGAVVALAGHPFLALFAAMAAGVLSGLVNAFLQTKMKVESMLAGIIVNTGLYTVNICIMGKSNLNMNTTTTVFSMMKELLKGTALESYSKMIVALIFLVIIAVLLALFLGTRLGLSIRATGNNIAMVKSSSINPAMTTTVGLCMGGAMTALAGCLLGEYQKSVDVNMGTGMVTVALASLIIGETIFGRRTIKVRILGVILGSCLYRVIVAIALRFNLPASALKLVSAVIVGIAISIPAIKEILALQKTKRAAMLRHKALYKQQKGGR